MSEHNARQLMRALSEMDDLRGEVCVLNNTLDKVHRYAVHKWGDGSNDGWLKIMELADPGLRKALVQPGLSPDE